MHIFLGLEVPYPCKAIKRSFAAGVPLETHSSSDIQNVPILLISSKSSVCPGSLKLHLFALKKKL